LSLAIVIVLTFLSTFNIPIITSLRPFLFTTYMNGWQAFFDFEVDFQQIIHEVIVLLVHIFGFYVLSLLVFLKKDILT